MDMSKIIFITGFARGGTSWLRDCIEAHPDVSKIPHEMVIFKGNFNRSKIESLIAEAITENKLTTPYFVNKAPANAPFIGKAARLFPESKFLFIMRDPRDVLISHQRGNQEWMGGKNSTVEGCMKKTEKYLNGYINSKSLSNVYMIKYEDLHQDFHRTLLTVFNFIGLPADKKSVKEIFRKTNFKSTTGRRHVENRDSAARKGVVGDWMLHLEKQDAEWFRENAYWNNVFKTHGYNWVVTTYQNVLSAMVQGNVKFLNEDEYIDSFLDKSCPNVLLMHDVDLIDKVDHRASILEAAMIESELNIHAFYNFLPLDDIRYRDLEKSEIIDLIKTIKRKSLNLHIGLHLNATEKFFPAKMDEVDLGHKDIESSIKYLHDQIDDYAKYGIEFRSATAHGYGRGTKEPNNTSKVFRRELGKRGIRLFDKDLRQQIQKNASHEARLHDVGGTITIKRFPTSGRITDPETYKHFQPGSLINFLTHPGNYDVSKPLPLGLRVNLV